MRALLIFLASMSLMMTVHATDAVTGRIVKVLPFLLDKQGRNAVSPSLFDRDAYQAHLRDHANEVSAMRFDVLWKATKAADENLKLALELRGLGTNSVPTVATLNTNIPPGKFGEWISFPLAGDEYRNIGKVAAWRVTLWNGDQVLSEQKSFLW